MCSLEASTGMCQAYRHSGRWTLRIVSDVGVVPLPTATRLPASSNADAAPGMIRAGS